MSREMQILGVVSFRLIRQQKKDQSLSCLRDKEGFTILNSLDNERFSYGLGIRYNYNVVL